MLKKKKCLDCIFCCKKISYPPGSGPGGELRDLSLTNDERIKLSEKDFTFLNNGNSRIKTSLYCHYEMWSETVKAADKTKVRTFILNNGCSMHSKYNEGLGQTFQGAANERKSADERGAINRSNIAMTVSIVGLFIAIATFFLPFSTKTQENNLNPTENHPNKHQQTPPNPTVNHHPPKPSNP